MQIAKPLWRITLKNYCSILQCQSINVLPTTLKVFNFAGTKFRECQIFSNSRVFNFANHDKIVISRV